MSVEFNKNVPIYIQVLNDIKKQIVTEDLKMGDKLNSVRDFSLDYGVNPNTIQKALQELEREGLIRTNRTNGRFVCASEESIKEIKKEEINNIVNDFLDKMHELKVDNDSIISYIEENY